MQFVPSVLLLQKHPTISWKIITNSLLSAKLRLNMLDSVDILIITPSLIIVGTPRKLTSGQVPTNKAQHNGRETDGIPILI
jgi:hypothetical protein